MPRPQPRSRFAGMVARSSKLYAILLGTLVSGLIGCRSPEPPRARAKRLETLSEAVGGPVASARIGDFLLENDQIRAVIEQGGSSRLPLDVGGGLVDLDLVRQDRAFQGGKGLDQLGTIAPVVNLFIARALGEKTVRITSTPAGAEVTAAAEAGPIQKVLDALGLLIRRDFIGPLADHSEFRIYNEYELRPGERLLRIRTTVGFDVPFCRPGASDACNAECDDILYDKDCHCDAIPARCAGGAKVVAASALPDRPEPMGLSDLLLGDLPRPLGTKTCATSADCDGSAQESCVDITTALGGESRVCRKATAYDPGLFIGDMLIFGGHLGLFIEKTGFDTESDFRRLFEAGEDTLSTPLKLETVLALGDRVSYGYAGATGKILVPIFGGPFSMGATAGAACKHDTPGCLAGTLLTAERWMSVGEGDATTAREPILAARGTPTGTVRGHVRWARSGKPASGVKVFALQDPRALSCEGACPSECADLSAATDEVIGTSWTPDRLLQLNRCRTRGGTYLEGHAGVASQALTDVGTDPLRDGSFRLVLEPGKYVLLAQDGVRSVSRLVPVEIAEGTSATANFLLKQPASLEYALFDERGEPVAGRLTIGQCLPQTPCIADSDCGGGQLCQAGACACARSVLEPLELGGTRYADGVVAFSQTGDGAGQLTLPEGTYELIFSHGPAYSTERQQVTLRAGVSTQVRGTLVKALDRFGWTSADFHVHAEQSLDSGLAMRDRAVSFLAEGVDVLSSSDHDTLSRYRDLLETMGASTRLMSQVGAEVTTQELGHFIGYPLAYREWTDGTPAERILGNGAPDWRDQTPGQIFDRIREAEQPGQPVVVEVPHPYSYFDYYNLDPVTLEPKSSVMAFFNPLLEGRNFSGRFDAMELLNSKAYDLFRRPTVGDIRRYSKGLDALRSQRKAGALDDVAYQRAIYALSTDVTRNILHRTPAEQQAAITGLGNDVACKCGSSGDCPVGRVCDDVTMTCVAPGAVTTGAPPPDEALCRSLRGVLDDWFQMLNRGVRRTGVSGSDVHGLYGYEAGMPRTYLKTTPTTGPLVTEKQIADAVLTGRAIVSNGPMIHLWVNGAQVGDTVTVAPGAPVSITLRVETAGWYDVDRVEVYRNGTLIHWLEGCTERRGGEDDPHGHPCVKASTETRIAVDTVLSDTPEVDAWYAVVVYGLDGRTLSPVYSSAPLARFGTFEVTQRIYDIVPRLGSLRVPRFPSLYPAFPLAVTNPVWVDLNGNGWTASLPAPPWCVKGKDQGC